MLSHLRGFSDDQSSGKKAPDGFYLSSLEWQKCANYWPWRAKQVSGRAELTHYLYFIHI